MIIQCPACGARAKLPDSKEGAKVRCAECERVYVAREPGAHRGGSSSKTNPALPIGIGAGVIALGLIFFMTRDRKEAKGIPTLPEKPAPVAQVAVDQIGWNSELVVHVRELHDLAARRENFALSNQISFPHVWARLQYAKGEAPAGSEEEGGIEIPLNLDTSGYEELSSGAIDELRGDVMTFLHSEEGANLPGNWSPFDGEVVSQTDDTALIHLAIEPRNESYGVGTRNIEWRLVKVDSKWKAWYWERWISPEEARSTRTARKKSYEQTTLSDGSIVIEGEPKPIPYMDETPMEQRAQIDKWIEQLIDLELPAKELTKVKGELELAGKHAIPPLLTKFYHQSQVGFADMDAAIQAQLVHQMLADITGYVTSFKAHDALGATQERRDSGVRQWYGWYNKHFKKFDERVEEIDGLEEAIDFKSDRERREYEKNKRLIEAEEAEKKAKDN